ncbi:hypothetical protein FXO38_24329 [Capsicum annuum]|nr:hypothetical protein FXO38_24329 [Capsicum annuum]
MSIKMGWTSRYAYMDIGTAKSILNPNIIPTDQWVPHFWTFGTISKGGVLTTRVITRHPIMIEFFPGVLYRIKILSSNILGKDLIIGFYIYMHLKNRLIVLTEGITFMGQFKQYSTMPRLFQIIDEDPIMKIEHQLMETSCAKSHKELLKKNKYPLCLNQDFLFLDRLYCIYFLCLT